MRQLGVAEDHRGDVDGEEAGAVQQRAAGVGEHGEGQHRDRVEAGGRQGDALDAVRAELADREADRQADRQLGEDRADQDVPRVRLADGGEGDDQDDHRRVVEAGLGLQQTGQPARQRHRPQYREDGRGVRGRDDRAEQQ